MTYTSYFIRIKKTSHKGTEYGREAVHVFPPFLSSSFILKLHDTTLVQVVVQLLVCADTYKGLKQPCCVVFKTELLIKNALVEDYC